MSWNNDNVLEFIELYRREQHLWDPKHPLHRNRTEVSDAWLRIQSSLSIHCSITDLKKKKESLMTSFRMHLSKKRTVEGYRTTWFAYTPMESFLGGKYECDSTNHVDTEFYAHATNYNSTTDGQDSANNVGRNSNSDRNSAGTGRQKCSKNLKHTITDVRFSKKRTDDTLNLRNELDSATDMDEYELYGQLLAKKLRKLDEHQRDLAMHEIDNVMFRAKMQTGNLQPRSYSTSPSPVPRKIKSPIFIVTQNNTNSNIQFEDENIQYHEQTN